MQSIRIKGYTFELSRPFAPGHCLTAGEAQALNDLRTENIQNNFRSFVNDQIARLDPGSLIPQPVLEALQSQLTEYDAGYSFNEKSTRSKVGDIEREIQTVAKERALSQAESPEQIAPLIAEFVNLPAVREEARIRVAANRSALAGGMDSL